MIPARQSTAKTIMVGPVLDADGVAVTGGVVADFKISKNGAAPAALDGSATLTHRHTGFYSLALTANDLDTVGTAQVTIDDTTNACPMASIVVVEEAVYDAFFAASAPGYVANAPVNVAQISGDSVAADNLEALLDGTGGVTLVASAFTLTTPITANATQISGDATAADNAEAFFDGTGYAGTNNVIPTVTTLTNPVTLANGAHGGSSATLTFQKIVGAASGDDDCVSLTGSGGGRGLFVKGGATGVGAKVEGGATSGEAIHATTSGNDYAVAFQGGGNRSGFFVSAPNAAAVTFDGTSAGLHLKGGTTGDGLKIDGGLTSGRGIVVTCVSGIGVLVSVDGGSDAITLEAGGSPGAGNLNGNLDGLVTGSVASVTGNVDGNVTGSVGSLAAAAQGNVRTAVGLAAANLDTQLALLATAAALATVDTVVDAIKVVTDALTAAAAANLALSAGTMLPGTVDNTAHTPTTTEFEADDITEATADHFNGRVIIFTSGALQYQATTISDYALVGGRGHFTVVALTEAPANNATFIII